MKLNLITILGTTTGLALVIANTQFAHAGWLQEAGRRLDRSVRTEAGRAAGTVRDSVTKTWRFTIVNRTDNSMHFRINGRPEILSAGYQRSYTYRGLESPEIAFDSSYRSGSQLREYELESGTFTFERRGSSEIDLFRK